MTFQVPPGQGFGVGVVDAPLFDAIARLATRRLGDLACLGPTDDGDESRKVFLRE